MYSNIDLIFNLDTTLVDRHVLGRDLRQKSMSILIVFFIAGSS